jgi:hypothetical protein
MRARLGLERCSPRRCLPGRLRIIIAILREDGQTLACPGRMKRGLLQPEGNETPISGLPEIGVRNTRKSGKPDLCGPSMRINARSASQYCAWRFLRWVPGLHPLGAKSASLLSPGTRDATKPAAGLSRDRGGRPRRLRAARSAPAGSPSWSAGRRAASRPGRAAGHRAGRPGSPCGRRP